MDAIEVGFDELRRLVVGVTAILPEKAEIGRAQRRHIAAGEHALEHAPVHLAGVMVELHLQMVGLDARGLPRRARAHFRRRRATGASCGPR